MQQWEHYVLYLDTSGDAASITGDIQRLEAEGWELVAVVPHTSEVSGEVLVAFFKRRKRGAGRSSWVPAETLTESD